MKANPKSYHLVLTVPNSTPILYRLEGGRIRLGRDAANQIQVAVKAISASHCEFHLDDEAGRCELIDLGSTNGTKVNGAAVSDGRFALRNGDMIVLGEAVTAQFIEAIEAVVRERKGASKPNDPTKPIRTVNPVAAAVAKQEAALRSRKSRKRKTRRKSGAFRLF